MSVLAQNTAFLAIGNNVQAPTNANLNVVMGNEGEIPAGWLVCSFKNTGSVTVAVNGTPLEPGEADTYDFVGKGQEAIQYQIGDNGQMKIKYTY